MILIPKEKSTNFSYLNVEKRFCAIISHVHLQFNANNLKGYSVLNFRNFATINFPNMSQSCIENMSESKVLLRCGAKALEGNQNKGKLGVLL
jgi:hypothetical protein